MRRYWVESEDVDGEWVKFHGETYHHIVDVCRQIPPARFEVLMPTGEALLVEMIEVIPHKKHPQAKARVIERRQIEPLRRPLLHLVLCVGRFPVLESVLEKIVELGVHSVHLVFSEFSFVKSSEKISESRIARWQKIVRMATQQTGRGALMAFHEPIPLDQLISQKPWSNSGGRGLFFYEGDGQTLKKWLEADNSSSNNVKRPQELWIFVGAEGGFSDREVQQLKTQGLVPVTLGSQVLRVETACVSVISVLKYLYDL